MSAIFKKNFSDEELMAKAQRGSEPALEALVQRFLSPVYNVALYYFHSSDEAEDATQEVFVKMWRNLKKFKSGQMFRPWIMTIAKNTCLDWFKKKRAIPFSAWERGDGTNQLAETIISPVPLPLTALQEAEKKWDLLSAMKKLSPRAARILSLYYFDGFNFREIAEELRISINTIKSCHRRALAELRGLLIDVPQL